MHAVGGHFVEEVFLFGTDEAVAFATEFDVEEPDGVENTLAIAGVATSGEGTAGEFTLFVAEVEFAGDELASVVGHPSGFFSLINREDRSACCHGVGM